MKLQITECPQDLFIKHIFADGHWSNAYAELFGPEHGSATHLHLYDVEKATEAFRLKKLVLPESVVTVSYPQNDISNLYS